MTFPDFPDKNRKFLNIKYINFNTFKIKNCRKVSLYY